MDIKILIACLIFLLTWRITICEQVVESKDSRIKRYHENHINEIKKESSATNIRNGRNKKDIELRPIVSSPINLINKNITPEKRIQLKTIKIKPKVPNQRKPFMLVGKNRDSLNLTYEGPNEAYVNNSVPKEEDVTNQLDNDTKDASTVLTEETTYVKQTDPKLGKKLNKSNKRISYNNISSSKPAIFIDFLTKENTLSTKSQLTKPSDTEQKLWTNDKQPEMERDDLQINMANFAEETINNNKTEDTNSSQDEAYLFDNKNDNENPKKHPFLDAIQNNRYLMCSPQDAPNASIVTDTTNVEDMELRLGDDKLPTNMKIAVNLITPNTDSKDEIEEVIIKNSALEEISEISDEAPNPEFNTNDIPRPYEYKPVLKSMGHERPHEYWYGHNNLKPYYQNFQQGYYTYYRPTPEYGLNYGNDVPRIIPRIQAYWNKVYDPNRDIYINHNANYGYYSSQPQTMQNYWYRDYYSNRGVYERIYRKWKNTEWNIKGKNAFKQLNNNNNLSKSYEQSRPIRRDEGFVLYNKFKL